MLWRTGEQVPVTEDLLAQWRLAGDEPAHGLAYGIVIAPFLQESMCAAQGESGKEEAAGSLFATPATDTRTLARETNEWR